MIYQKVARLHNTNPSMSDLRQISEAIHEQMVLMDEDMSERWRLADTVSGLRSLARYLEQYGKRFPEEIAGG